jgi:hypothetical protein
MAEARWRVWRSENREPDSETVRKRALDDRRGMLFRVISIKNPCSGLECVYELRHSVNGRSDQLDVVCNGINWERPISLSGVLLRITRSGLKSKKIIA